MGLRRPTTIYEREGMAHLRHRIKSPRIHGNDENRGPKDSAYVVDNALRFSRENVIIFGSLESFSSKVNDYHPDLTENIGTLIKVRI